MRVLLGLTYYRPHVSGLTIYVERLARGLAERGHDVIVLASQHDRSLPRQETLDGVRVVRVPYAARVGKAVVMPSYPLAAARLAAQADVVSLHLPQLEAPLLAALARARGAGCTVTHHCDLQLPPGLVNRVADEAAFASGYAAARLANRVVAYTSDYADHSRLLRHVRARTTVIPPPVDVAEPGPDAGSAFRSAHGLDPAATVVGFAGRFAAEKGIGTLVDAVPPLAARFPKLVVAFAGPADGVVGEGAYRERLRPAIEALGARWRFLGTLDPVHEMPGFYAATDCLVLPSVNSTESFGLVQVEAMLCGTPVVASDLPGVRHAVRATGMGEIAPPGDPAELAAAVRRVLENPDAYTISRAEVTARLGLDGVFDACEALFEDVRRR
jgi:glycosyltransferase involved in cell wall biosynthesis